MRSQFSIALTLLLVAVACAKKPAEQTSAEPSAAAPSAAPAVAAVDTAAAADDDDIDLPDDFADQAAAEITADNVETQVAALEKELEQP